ncbi:Zinc transporter ZIP10 (Solute carrier family 39 member 10) (Zrt- and Irt-like protein 10) (ZIP-10), partial [Durusdinium trenchii]
PRAMTTSRFAGLAAGKATARARRNLRIPTRQSAAQGGRMKTQQGILVGLVAACASWGVHGSGEHGGGECEPSNDRFLETIEALHDSGVEGIEGTPEGVPEGAELFVLECNATTFSIYYEDEVLDHYPFGTDTNFDSCDPIHNGEFDEDFCEVLLCEDGELVVEHFETCCTTYLANPSGFTAEFECEIENILPAEITAATWGKGLTAGFISALASVAGVMIVVASKGGITRRVLDHMSAFAVGLLLSFVFAHLVPESVEEAEFTWKQGAALLGGMASALLIQIMFHHHGADDLDKDGPVIPTSSDMEKGGQPPVLDKPLIANIVIGDGMCNLTDGLVIGLAFAFCGDSNLGWITLAAILLHEVPQEVVDFVVLIKAGLSFNQALLFNFLSSLLAVLGVIIALAVSGEVSTETQGLLLCYGSGYLAFVALATLTPRVFNDDKKTNLTRFGLFVLGAILIGLTNLYHEHCEAAHGHE